MKIDQEMIEKILDRRLVAAWQPPNKELSSYVASEIDRILSIDKEILLCKTDRSNADANYSIEIQSINSRIRKAQQRCRHESTRYHGDASGGSDSETVCQICGASI